MEFSDLSPEMQEKAKQCKTVEDFIDLADECGQDLSEEQLKAIAGGESSTWTCEDGCWAQM